MELTPNNLFEYLPEDVARVWNCYVALSPAERDVLYDAIQKSRGWADGMPLPSVNLGPKGGNCVYCGRS